MKKLLCMMMLAMLAGTSIAQNSAIKKARAILDESVSNEQYKDENGNTAMRAVVDWAKVQQAQETLTPALTNPKTKDFTMFWEVQADIYQRYMANELNKAVDKQEFNTLALFDYITQTLDASYEVVKADTKGVSKMKAENNMSKFREYYMYCGQFFSNDNDMQHACDAFDAWLSFPEKYPQMSDYSMERSAGTFEPAMVSYYAAMMAYQSKQYDRMEKFREQAMSYEKEAVNVRQLYLAVMLEKGDTAAWEQSAEQYAIEGCAGESLTQNILAHYFSKGDYTKVVAFAQELCNQRPEDKLGPYAQGLVAMNKEDYATALEWFDKALEIDPDYFDALFNAGVCLCNQGYEINDALNSKKLTKAENEKELDKVREKYRAAEPYFLRIRELRPDEPNRWALRLRTIYYITGDKEKEAEMDAYCN